MLLSRIHWSSFQTHTPSARRCPVNRSCHCTRLQFKNPHLFAVEVHEVEGAASEQVQFLQVGAFAELQKVLTTRGGGFAAVADKLLGVRSEWGRHYPRLLA